jgi:chromosomal replication initiation ATPase DnaA
MSRIAPYELQGELIARLMARIDALEARVDMLTARRHITPADSAAVAVVRCDPIARIVEAVALEYRVPVAKLRGKEKAHCISHPRQHAFLIANEAGHSIGSISRFFKKDHTTVIHGIRTAKARRDN